MGDTLNNAGWSGLLHQLAQDATILEQTVRTIRAEVPGYEDVPTEALNASVQRNIKLCIRTVRGGLHLRPQDVVEADALAAERHAQGVPVGSVLSGFRACMSVILDRLLTAAPQCGIPPEEVLSCSTLLWSLGDAFSTRAVMVYTQKEVSMAVADSARRAQWIGAAVSTRMDPAELARGAALYDVPTDHPLRALILHAGPGQEEQVQRELLAWAESTGVRVLSAVRAGAVVGIAVSPLNELPDPSHVTVGWGPEGGLEHLSHSFETASLALHAAERVGVTGLVDLSRLSWRFGIHTSPETTALLEAQYVAPVEEAGEFGQHLWEALEAFLTHRRSIPLAASSIPVHVNTLRYRLQRFSEITGADLGDTNVLVELSWVLASQRGQERGQDRGYDGDPHRLS